MLGHVRVFATLWTVAHHSPLSTGLPRQRQWSGWPSSTPGTCLTQELNLTSCIGRRILYH